jgi:riboflavin synthase
MFTGLVQTTGTLVRRTPRGPGQRFVVAANLGSLELGESIAVNGACLTVAALTSDGFAADLSAETLQRTALGRVTVGASLNLERALRAGDRLGGHFVSGHVDGVAVVEALSEVGEDRKVVMRAPAELAAFLAPKGSVTLDGVSLTINTAQKAEFDVMLIPHTLGATTLKSIRIGSELNLEIDILARYAVHFLKTTRGEDALAADASLARALSNAGWSR